MLNRSVNLVMSTSVLKVLPGKLDTCIKGTHLYYLFPNYQKQNNMTREHLNHRQQAQLRAPHGRDTEH